MCNELCRQDAEQHKAESTYGQRDNRHGQHQRVVEKALDFRLTARVEGTA